MVRLLFQVTILIINPTSESCNSSNRTCLNQMSNMYMPNTKCFLINVYYTIYEYEVI